MNGRTLAGIDGVTKWQLPPRQEVIDRMLAGYMQARETMHKGQGRGASDMSGVLLMPEDWTPSYQVLEPILGRLRMDPDDAWEQRHLEEWGWVKRRHWHLREFYFAVRIVRQPSMRKTKKGRDYQYEQDGVKQFELAYVRDRGIDHGRVRSAIEWIDGFWEKDWKVQPSVPGWLCGCDNCKNCRERKRKAA